ncbi:MAG: amidohydrolase family protein [Acidobacteria bacterium]|nr:amidohydrolase family protein [Acidobacteriota bacterium]
MRNCPKMTLHLVFCLTVLWAFETDKVWAQLPPEVARYGYADTIFVNGKIVSMDDKSTSTEVGNIYQSIAVKGTKIVKLGTSQEVRALAGPDTTVFDLKGRTMIPGIIESHRHIYGGAVRQLDRLGFKYPPDGIKMVSMQADRDLEKTQAIMRDAIQDAVKDVNPGDWVVLRIQGHPEAPREAGMWGFARRLTNLKTLDLWTPDNPLLVSPGLRGNVNSKALEVLNEFLPGYSASIQETMHGIDIGEDIPSIGWVGSQEMSVITWELFLEKLPAATLAQALKIQSEEAASVGITTISTRIPFPKVMSGYATLAGLGQMPIRLSAHYEVHRMPTEPDQTRQIYRRTGVLQGIGNDYFWIDGVASERWDSIYPESCTGPDTQAPPHIKSREVCPKPGDLPWDVLENALKSGWRLAGVHMCGSESARAYFRMIDRARAANGMSMEDIRNMKMTTEHCNLIGKQPDIIQKLKDYGIIISCGPDYIRDVRPQPDWDAAARHLRDTLPFLPADDAEGWLELAHGTYRECGDGLLRFDWDPALVKPLLGTRGDVGELWPLFRALGDRPKLAVRGELSDVLSARTFEQMAERMPGLVRITVPGVGHVPGLKDSATREAIGALLARA